jgi:hypothetical protein
MSEGTGQLIFRFDCHNSLVSYRKFSTIEPARVQASELEQFDRDKRD